MSLKFPVAVHCMPRLSANILMAEAQLDLVVNDMDFGKTALYA